MEIFGEKAINLFESIIILDLFVLYNLDTLGLKIIKSFFIIILNTNK